MTRKGARGAVAGALFALLGACGPHGTTTPARQLTRSELSVAELRYGIAPVPDPATVYQPEVVLVGGGAAAIRAQSGNGLQWTIDANAPHARDLAAGKIFFMTSLAVGRVLEVHPEGANLVVTVGPVELTELLHDADLRIEAMPVDFGEAIPHQATELWGSAESIARSGLPAPAFVPAMDYQDTATAPPGPPGLPNVPQVPGLPALPGGDSYKDLSSAMMNFTALPFVEGDKVGVRIAKTADGLTVAASASVTLAKPKLNARIVVQGGTLVNASVSLEGAAGLSWRFKAGTDVGRSANVKAFLDCPVDLFIPIAVIHGFPVSVTLRQTFEIKTAFGVRNSTLEAQGDYSFKGSFDIGYLNGKWDVQGPTEFHASQSLLQHSGGISIAANGIDVAHQLHIITGVGAFGFAVGPYINFISAVGLFKGSDLGFVPCREATLHISMSGGVGYFLPKSIVRGINSILAALNIRYRLKDQGTIQPSGATTLVSTSDHLKGCEADKG